MAVFATFFDHILDMARQRDISVDKALEETRALGVTQVEVSAATARQHMDALTRGLAGLGMTISSRVFRLWPQHGHRGPGRAHF